MNFDEIIEAEKKHIWHPCSQMQDYEKYPAIHIERGEGVWLYKKNGEKILDAISSWWVNIFGHGNKYIADKIAEQAHNLEHVIFANYTHTPAIELAVHLSKMFDDKLPKVFYADNGSSSIEAALKMSFHYWLNCGKPEKSNFIYISGAYHGETIGALSAGAISLFRKIYEPLLMKTTEAPGPDCFRCPYSKERNSCDAECFAKTEKVLIENHSKTAAVIIEPVVQCAAGMKIYSPVFLRKLRETTKKLGIHLICDEIAVGFGRTGKMMASHHAGIVPDLAVVSKGLTGGFLPLAAILTNDEIYSAFYGTQTEKAFLHSHSYSGNPIACAAGCAVFDLFEKMDILEKNKITAKNILSNLEDLKNHKHIGEIRNIGMITAIEIVKDKASKKSFEPQKHIGNNIYRLAEKNGVLLRNLGDIIYFMPPYIINEKEINFMTGTAKKSIFEILKD